MSIHKEIKIPLSDGTVIKTPLCDPDKYGAPTEYRWDDVTCLKCIGMKITLEEKHKTQIENWKKNKF